MADQLTDVQKIAKLTADNEAAQTQIKTLTQTNSEAQDTIKTLTAAGQAAQKQIETLSLAKATSDKQLEEATKVVVDLKTQLAEKLSGVITLPTVKIGKDTYELVGGDFLFEGREISIEVLKEDQALTARLIKEKVGNLRLMVK